MKHHHFWLHLCMLSCLSSTLFRITMSVNANQFIVVRHSERLDETNANAWREMITKYKSSQNNNTINGKVVKKRDVTSYTNDPPISNPTGVSYAKEAAVTIKRLLDASSIDYNMIRIFSSRLLRSIETSYHIAKALNQPIYLSGGLSNIISVVKNTKGCFEFISIAELQWKYPDVEFINCDVTDISSATTISSIIKDSKGNKKKSMSSTNQSTSTLSEAPLLPSTTDVTTTNVVSSYRYVLPIDSWRETIRLILQNNDGNYLNILVAHRETVRKLAGRHLNTPYCCIGVFQMTPLDSSISSSSSSSNSQDMGTSTATIAVTSSESMSNAVTSLKSDLSLIDHQPSSPNMRDASSTITIATINNLASKYPSSRDSNIDHKMASKVSKLSNDHSSYELLQLFDKNGGNIDITAL